MSTENRVIVFSYWPSERQRRGFVHCQGATVNQLSQTKETGFYAACGNGLRQGKESVMLRFIPLAFDNYNVKLLSFYSGLKIWSKCHVLSNVRVRLANSIVYTAKGC